MEKETKTMFSKLADVNVNEHIDKKKTGSTELSYLSWAWAWKYFKEAIPDAKYTIRHWEDKPYLFDEKTGYMVETSITAGGETHEMWLPVMDSTNHAMLDKAYIVKTKYNEFTVPPATMFDINKTIMRCLVKNMAMFGLGLYIYAGEDLPNDTEEMIVKQKQPKTVEEYTKLIDDCEDEQSINRLFYEWSKAYAKGTDNYNLLSKKSFDRKKQIVGS